MRKYLVCITVLVVTLILVFTNCNKAKQLENSSFFSDDEYIYYTNTLGDLYKYSFYNKSKEKIMDELYLRAFSDKYFIGYNENTIKIFNRINKKMFFVEDIKTSSIAVFGDDIFYINANDNNYIYKININSMENTIFLNERTNKLSVNKDYIFYEKNSNCIYMCDLVSKNQIKFYEGEYCFYFYCDDNYVYLSDYLNNNKVSRINIYSKKCEIIYNIPTLNFYFYNNYLYYIPLIDENYYDKKIKYHIYRFNIIDNSISLLI